MRAGSASNPGRGNRSFDWATTRLAHIDADAAGVPGRVWARLPTAAGIARRTRPALVRVEARLAEAEGVHSSVACGQTRVDFPGPTRRLRLRRPHASAPFQKRDPGAR